MFKKITLATLLVASTLMGSGINWIKDYKSGVKKATKQDKPIMFVHSCHFGYCKKIQEKIFSDKNVIDKLNKEFVSIISYGDDGDYLPAVLQDTMTPTIWFMLPDGSLMFDKVADGHIDAYSLLNGLNIVKSNFKQIRERDRLKNTPYSVDFGFKYYTNITDAKKRAKELNKPIFLLLGKSNCKYCVILKNNTLSDKKVKAKLKKDFVVAVLDANKYIPHEYATRAVPAMWFLQPNGMPISEPVMGAVGKGRLLNTFDIIIKSYKTNKIK